MKQLLVLCVLSGVLAVGCKSASTTASAPAKEVTRKTASIPEGYTINTVGILGIANTAGDPEAMQMEQYLVNALYGTEATHFRSVDGFAKDAELAGVKAEYDKLQAGWRSHRVADPTLLAKVCAATKYDAVMGMEVNSWQQYKLQATEEGTSYTNLGVKLTLIAADAVTLWESSALRKFESQPYDPSFNIRSDQSGLTRTTSQSAIPEPPKIERVAPELAAEAVQELPKLRQEP